MKKIDSFSAEKNGNTWHKVALFRAESINFGHSALHGPAAHIQRYGYGNTRRKVALFSATALAPTFFH